MEQTFFLIEEMYYEGRWLIWSHYSAYDIKYRREINSIWIQMTNVLHNGENVHTIAYDEKQQEWISNLSIKAGLDMKKFDFTLAKNKDV